MMRAIQQRENDLQEVEAEVELLVQTRVVSPDERNNVAAVLQARRVLKGMERREPDLEDLPRLLELVCQAIDSMKREGDRLGELGDVVTPLEKDPRCTDLMGKLLRAIDDFRDAIGAIRVPEYHEFGDVARIRKVIDEALMELQQIMRV